MDFQILDKGTRQEKVREKVKLHVLEKKSFREGEKVLELPGGGGGLGY